MNPALWRNRLSFGLGTLGRDMSAALVSMYYSYNGADTFGGPDHNIANVK